MSDPKDYRDTWSGPTPAEYAMKPPLPAPPRPCPACRGVGRMTTPAGNVVDCLCCCGGGRELPGRELPGPRHEGHKGGQPK